MSNMSPRWGTTPLDLAERNDKSKEAAQVLKNVNAPRTNNKEPTMEHFEADEIHQSMPGDLAAKLAETAQRMKEA